MAKRKSTTRRQRVAPPQQYVTKPSIGVQDCSLIRLCCTIAADFAAFHAAFTADPDGNNANAEKVAYHYFDRAKKNAAKAATIKAVTIYGLHAKAAAVNASMRDDECNLEAHTEALAFSLLDDTSRIAGEYAAREYAERREAKTAQTVAS